MSSRILLKAGTRVKHGTVASNLYSILDSGLQPNHSRHTLRAITEETPKEQAVYVGGLSAYFGAWASASALIKEYEMLEPRLQLIADSVIKGSDYIDPPFAIPVVLEIELAEDTELVGDEDYALWIKGSDGSVRIHPDSTSQQIWSLFASGGLVRESGIPSSWIRNIEFPQLIRDKKSADSQFRRLTDDCLLFASAVHQNQQLIPAREIQIADALWHEDTKLSQKWSFSKMQVDKLLALPALVDKKSRLYNIVTMAQIVTKIGMDVFNLKFA